MALGNPSLCGRMKGLPADATSRTLTELWVQEFPLMLESNVATPYGTVIFMGGMGMRRGGVAPTKPQPLSREQLIGQWKQNKWVPTPQLLFDNGKVYIKTIE